MSHSTWKKKLAKISWVRHIYYGLLGILGFFLQPWTRSKIDGYLKGHSTYKLNIGCGTNRLSEWLNTDLQLGSGVIFLDASKPLPVPSETFDYIFTEHMIEHLEYMSGKKFIGECSRVLKKGGKLRVATPDLAFLVRFYQDKESAFKKEYAHWVAKKYFPEYGKEQDAFVINNFFYSWGHKFLYDFEALNQLLKDNGFTEIRQWEVGQSEDPHLRGLEAHGCVIGEKQNAYETMVVEAIKA